MKHYEYINYEDEHSIFYITPCEIKRDSEKEIIAHSLGALLYMPALREQIAYDIINKKYKGLKSIALCLEDAIGDKQIEESERGITSIFEKLNNGIKSEKIDYEEIPFIFIRIRDIKQMEEIACRIGENIKFLTGFIFPKFIAENGEQYFKELLNINKKYSKKIYGMPILETRDIMYKELRGESLKKISEVLNSYSELVLNVRIGATDFENLFGIRRGYDINIYDIAVLRDCISDIINMFSRVENSFVISGPVWEYFVGGDRVMKPQLRNTPFAGSYGKSGPMIRKKIIDEYIDGLMHETVLDKANGLWGKTTIHPSHIIPVQSLYSVTHEEYVDALSILENNTGDIGVLKSNYENKMNEIKTHTNWANKIMMRAKIYGVLNEGKIFTDLFPKQNEA